MGILNIAADISVTVGYRQNGAQRAAALDLEGKGALFLLEHIPHHGGAQQGPAQCRGGHGQKRVDITGPFYQVPTGDGYGLDQAVPGDRSYDLVVHT